MQRIAGKRAGSRAGSKQQPARCLRKTQDKLHGKEAAAQLNRRAYTSPYAFFAQSRHEFTGVVAHHACAGVYVGQMLRTSAYTFSSRSLQDVHMR